MAYIYDLADTWNSGTTTFTGIKLNVTDSASAAGSLLMDLQKGGASQFRLRKDGVAIFGIDGSTTVTSVIIFNNFHAAGSTSISGDYTTFNFSMGAQLSHQMGSSGFITKGVSPIGWSSSPYTVSGPDLFLFREAAGTLAQRNGANNPQAFHIYNTYTDANNYERGFIRWVSNVLQIGAETGTTGTGRSVFISPGGAASQTVSVATVGFQSFDLRYNATPFIDFRKYAGGGTTGWVTNTSDMHYRWTASNTALAEGDVGIKRDSAGVLKITNGNNAATGTGKLIFIVPTTDPGITGALWNNAGTLSISA